MCQITVGKGCVQHCRPWPPAVRTGEANVRQLAQKGSKRALSGIKARVARYQMARSRCSKRALRDTFGRIAGAVSACQGRGFQHMSVHVLILHMHGHAFCFNERASEQRQILNVRGPPEHMLPICSSIQASCTLKKKEIVPPRPQLRMHKQPARFSRPAWQRLRHHRCSPFAVFIHCSSSS